MAVQAQYPSNALLNRGGGNAYASLGDSLQRQSSGLYFDQSEMLNNFARIGVNERKRAREGRIGCDSPELSHIQIHPQNVSTGLHLAFGDQPQKQRLYVDEPEESILPDDLETLVNQQQHEINRFLHSQAEHFRRTLSEKRHRHCRTLISTAEDAAAKRLKQTEAEAEWAMHRNASLEARAMQLLSEVQIWQGKARANEAAAISIHAQLEKRAAEISTNGGGVDDCESVIVDPRRVDNSVSPPICKACRDGVATVVLFPCRHLCVCGGCNDAVQACPLCLSHVKSRLHVILS